MEGLDLARGERCILGFLTDGDDDTRSAGVCS
jgi:hypothetical protein